MTFEVWKSTNDWAIEFHQTLCSGQGHKGPRPGRKPDTSTIIHRWPGCIRKCIAQYVYIYTYIYTYILDNMRFDIWYMTFDIWHMKCICKYIYMWIYHIAYDLVTYGHKRHRCRRANFSTRTGALVVFLPAHHATLPTRCWRSLCNLKGQHKGLRST